MMTADTYCLVPREADLAGILAQLFAFDRVIYHDGHQDVEVPIGSPAEAIDAFSTRMGTDHIRFRAALVEHTEGGWLYRLADGSAVVGLSADLDRRETARNALTSLIPGGTCIEFGDQPPPDTPEEFERVHRMQRGTQNHSQLLHVLLLLLLGLGVAATAWVILSFF